ncbi:MAG TPA: DNA polymerase I [Clostridiales bacterium]|nr:DNA polymerase I [Clostridiales bacterium]
MGKMIVFDGNSILNRAFYGIRPLINKDGLPTNAVFGFVNIIEKGISSLGDKPDYAVMAFDMKAKTFRHDACDTYKATRKGMPDELAVQLPYAKQVAEGLGLVILEKEGYEADDILGTLSRMAKENSCECILITGDRDSLQLVGDGTVVHLAATNETKIYDEKAIIDNYGVKPAQLIDVKAIMGDSSDNITGVPGIGEKGALKLINEYGSLDGVYKNIEKITGAVKDRLVSGKDSAVLSRFLAEICKNVPISNKLNDYKYKDKDKPLLNELFTKLEFKQFIDRFELTKEEKKAEKAEFIDGDVKNLTELASKGKIYIQIKDDKIFATDKNEYITVPLDKNVKSIFENEKNTICVWSVKELYHILRVKKIDLKSAADDLSLLGYVLYPADNGVSFEKLALMYLGISSHEIDVTLFPALLEKMLEKAEENNQISLYKDLELPLSLVLAKMEAIGFSVDKKGLEDYLDTLSAWLKQTERSIFAEVGREFNINSPKQLGTVLFEELHLPHFKKTKSGYSTDVEVLEKLRFHKPEVIEPILYYRTVQKLKSTYCEGLLKVISSDDGRIHTTFKQTQTMTGRLSSVEPNLQNIPVRQEMGKELRRFFVAKEGHVLIDADYSQIELRVLAHISGDETLIDAFLNNEDIHTLTASQVFGVPFNMVTSEMRKRAKAVNFGIVYGIGDFSLAEDIGVSRKEAKAYIEGYFAKYPEVKNYMTNIIASSKQAGFVTTLLGRRRYIPDITSPKAQIRAFGERVAMNTPIQGSAADIIKKAMIDTEKALTEAGLASRLILQIHDELIVEAPENEALKAAEILKNSMENAYKMSVPLSVDAHIGKTWYDAKGN